MLHKVYHKHRCGLAVKVVVETIGVGKRECSELSDSREFNAHAQFVSEKRYYKIYDLRRALNL